MKRLVTRDRMSRGVIMDRLGYVVLPSKSMDKPVEAVLHPGDRKDPFWALKEAWEESLARGRARVMVVYNHCIVFLTAVTPFEDAVRKYLGDLTQARDACRSTLAGQLFI
jgi:hypothetical protein